jgi:integrin-linked kinase-associated serine/threonine phosphatase 2C
MNQAGCSATPDIQAFELTDKDKFLILGCDGFWG